MRRKPTILSTPQQKKINYLQYRFTPYFLILLFVLGGAVFRWYLLTEWPWYFHVMSFFGQFVMMTIIWHLIVWLNKRLETRFPFEEGPLQRMFLQILFTLLILSPIVAIGLKVTRPIWPVGVNDMVVGVTLFLFTIVIILFNFSFYAAYFFTNWQESVEERAALEIQAAQLQREKFDLQYHQLKNQVNPHYLFNTLTSLDGLIHTNPELASEFVRHMAKVYRYVLQHKENEVVSLDEELEFISHYIELLQIRYGAGINIHHNISAAAKERGIVMVTTQMLIDNAIKHNIINPNHPLKIIIWDEGDYLQVYNNKQLRRQIETSNKQGLAQLQQLYSYHSGKPVIIDDNDEHFTIKIPLL
ncbi:sensor histidine kinase [Polluticoccus soli]|uniref:sensor histidine kinase n=1 Tax=Polluticoccus soli TaxID=3034150 RepID=UPI0023E14133|nr:sensor histidine kinase [Flavipsychrobacter sp. JY13-12]